MIETMSELLAVCERDNKPIYQVLLDQEKELHGKSEAQTYAQMDVQLEVMENSVERGLEGVTSHSGLTGMDGKRIREYRESGKSITEGVFLKAVNYAIAINEVNASMGIICATPTAGSAGVAPAVLLAARERLQLSRKQQLNFLLTSGMCGMIIGNNASISGAAGGCQAEIGSASAMAAAALVEAAGGTPEQSAHALSIALMNILGLACDPVAGLVEIPCINRNAMGASNALAAAEMALAGVKSRIPCDEVIVAMGRVGDMMPHALKETALGGLADTPTARQITEDLGMEGQVPGKTV